VDWPAFTLLVLISGAILLVPGGVLGYAVGLRGALVLLCSAPLTIGLVSAVAVGLSYLPEAWTPLNFALGAATVILVLFLGWWLRRIGSAHIPDLRLGNFNPVAALIGTVVTAGIVITTLVVRFGSAEYFVQSEANAFHLNAIRNSLDSGQSAIFSIAQLNAGSAPFLYPAAWEDYVTLVVSTARLVIPSVSIPAATNAATIAVLILGWGLACQAIAQVVGGRSILQAVLAAALATSFIPFGWLPITGADYSSLLAYAILASALVVLLLLTRLHSDNPPLRALSRFSREARQRRLTARGAPLRVQPAEDPETLHLFGAHPRTILTVAGLFYLAGAAAAHPSAALALGGMVLIACWGVFFHRLFQPANWVLVLVRVLAALLLIAASAGFGYGWLLLATAKPSQTPQLTGVATELLNLTMGTPAGVSGTTVTAAMLVVGVAGAVWLRRFTALALWLAATALYVLSVGGPNPVLASVLGYGFGHDPALLAALWLVATMPLLLAGTGGLVKALALLTGNLDDLGRGTVTACVGAAILAAIAVPQQLFSVQPQLQTFAADQVIPSATTRLSPDEVALLKQAGAIVTGGDRLIGDPGNGSSFAYALAGVPVVYSGLSFTESNAAAQLRTSLFDRSQLSATCAAVRQLRAYYYADFGPSADPGRYPGLTKPDPAMLELVAERGQAAIYRITACPQ